MSLGELPSKARRESFWPRTAGVTLMAQIQGQQNLTIPATYDNATKLMKIGGQDFVGIVTYGLGAIGTSEPRTAHSFIHEFEDTIKENGRMSTLEAAEQLSDFYSGQYADLMSKPFPQEGMVFMVAGYDEGAPYGSVFEFNVPHKPKPVEQNADGFGMRWGGQKDIVSRIINWFDDQLLAKTKEAPDGCRGSLHSGFTRRSAR